MGKRSTLRKWKREADARLADRCLLRDEQGRVILNMTVQDDSDFLSVFSESEAPVISTGVAEFIDNALRAVPPREPVVLRIRSSCIDEEEKPRYEAAIKEYYAERYLANAAELRRNRLLALLLLLVGVIVLAFAFRIEHRIWAEVVDIAAWVLVWESVDVSLFRSHAARAAGVRCLALMNMEIQYL